MQGESDRGPPVPAEAKMADRVFFKEHPERRFHIRLPIGDEYRQEFRQFGLHAEDRRRIIVFRVAAGMAKRHMIDFGRLAFLAFADETIEDTDEIVKPIADQIMADAAKAYGMAR